jgi:hypothetical protein
MTSNIDQCHSSRFLKQTHTIKPVTARHDTSELLSSTRETVSTIEKSFSLVELTVGDRLTTGYMGDFAPRQASLTRFFQVMPS